MVTVCLLAGCGPSQGRPGPAQTGPAATGPASTGPAATGPAPTGAGGAWVTYDHDAARSGVDPSSPPAGALRAGWTSPGLDGAVYAQPLVVGSSVLVATEADTVYSLDGDSGSIQWSRHLGTAVDGASLPCGNIDPSGITGTPVADPGAGTMWVVTFSAPAHHTLWSLDLRSGAVRSQVPADPPGSDPAAQQQRGALTLAGSRVYVPYGGLFGDCSDYHGWVMGYPVTGGGAPYSYETPTDREGGIWSPPGAALGAGGSLLVATGNGTPVDAVDGSDSVVRLSASLGVEDSFTPSDFAALSAADKDLGSTSPALLAGGLVLQVGKDGVGYLLAGDHLGGVGGQLASAPVCGGAFGGDAVAGRLVFVSCFDGLYAVAVTASPAPALSVAWHTTGTHPGPPVVAGGVVWTVERSGGLAGYDATTGAPRGRAAVTPVGSFPTLAAASGSLYVPGGDRILAFSGA